MNALSKEEVARALGMIRSGASQADVARTFGVTKNVIGGLWHRHGEPVESPPSTVYDRCGALEARMEAVLRETLGVGKEPNPHGRVR